MPILVDSAKDYRAFVFVLHDDYGLLLLHCTRRKRYKNKPPHFQLPGGHVDHDDIILASDHNNNEWPITAKDEYKDQLLLASKIGAARELYEETGIDIREQLDRFIPSKLRKHSKLKHKSSSIDDDDGDEDDEDNNDDSEEDDNVEQGKNNSKKVNGNSKKDRKQRKKKKEVVGLADSNHSETVNEVLSNEHKRRLFFCLRVTDSDFIKPPDLNDDYKTSLPMTTVSTRNPTIKKNTVDPEFQNSSCDLNVKLSKEHSGFTFVSQLSNAIKMLKHHSGGRCMEALQMILDRNLDPIVQQYQTNSITNTKLIPKNIVANNNNNNTNNSNNINGNHNDDNNNNLVNGIQSAVDGAGAGADGNDPSAAPRSANSIDTTTTEDLREITIEVNKGNNDSDNDNDGQQQQQQHHDEIIVKLLHDDLDDDENNNSNNHNASLRSITVIDEGSNEDAESSSDIVTSTSSLLIPPPQPNPTNNKKTKDCWFCCFTGQ